MSGAEPPRPVDEFDFIAEVLRPLSRGAPEALDLRDDAALITPQAGLDLVISADAMVEGVHFLPDDPPELVARKLMRANVSDLAAKGADPYGYFLTACWPPTFDLERRRAFVSGLARDQELYGLRLFGGDTTATSGPLVVSMTILGRAPQGAMVRRGGASPGDRLLVSGTIGDGWLGLRAARGDLPGACSPDAEYLADRYRLPRPRVEITGALREHASSAADVSDGLLADAGHIAAGSGVSLVIDLERLPLSAAAGRWLKRTDRGAGLVALASGGDDYEIVCTAAPEPARRLMEAAARAGLSLTDIGEVRKGQGTLARLDGRQVEVARAGWRHG